MHTNSSIYTAQKLKEHFENTSDLNEEKNIMLDIYTEMDWVMF